jgi:HEAT repeat protein
MNRMIKLGLLLCIAGAASLSTAADLDLTSLKRSLASKDAKTRVAALHDAAQLEPAQIDEAAGELIKALSDPDPYARAYAALALGKTSNTDAKVVTALAKSLTDKEARVRGMAVRSLRRLKPEPELMLPIMIEALEQAEPQGALVAVETIAAAGDKAIDGLTKALDSERARYWACLALGEAGPKAKKAVPALVKALSDERPEVQLQALMALGKIGPDAASAAPEIAQFLNAELPATQYAAVFALGSIASAEGADALKAAGKSDDQMLKTLSAWGLAKLSPDNQVVVKRAAEQLVASLKSNDQYVRQAAARGLADLKADPELVRPALISALGDSDPAVRGNVVEAVSALGARAVPEVAKGLKNPQLRGACAAILGRIGPEAKSALPALVAALGDAGPTKQAGADEFRSEALVAIALIGPSKELVEKCTPFLSSESELEQRTATYVLGKIGPDAKAALPAIRKNLSSDDERLRMISLWALLQITPKDAQVVKAAIPALIKALDAERPLVRLEAALALGKLGAQASAAKEPLQKLADEDDDEAVRRAATESLEQIGG